jgi:hypothetical protein
MTAAMIRSIPVLFALAAAFACGGGRAERGDHGTSGPTTPAAYPTTLIRPSAIDGDFALEQEVTITHAEGENGFRAVLQKQGDEIVLVGLGPHGGRAFALTQRGLETSYESFVPMELPFPPEYMLYDVHRTWFVRSGPPEGGTGDTTTERDGERIHETWREGRLESRTFERVSGDPAGTITARYPGGLPTGAPARTAPPDEVTLDNGWFGYTIRVRTIRWTPIP